MHLSMIGVYRKMALVGLKIEKNKRETVCGDARDTPRTAEEILTKLISLVKSGELDETKETAVRPNSQYRLQR